MGHFVALLTDKAWLTGVLAGVCLLALFYIVSWYQEKKERHPADEPLPEEKRGSGRFSFHITDESAANEVTLMQEPPPPVKAAKKTGADSPTRLKRKKQERIATVQLSRRQAASNTGNVAGSLRPRVATGSAIHIGTRKEQQDALYVSDPLTSMEKGMLLAVLCDGMGGMEHGAQASKLAVEMMAEDFQQFSGGDIASFLEGEAHKIDQSICRQLSGGDIGSVGTTMVSVIVKDNQLYWASVGDSRLYILREQEIVQATRDHNLQLLLTERVERGEITAKEAEENEEKEALISFLGMGGIELLDINRQPFVLQRGDVVLLCSDGLTKSLSNAQIQSFIMEGPENPGMSARILTHRAFALKKGSNQDNTTVIIIRFSE